LGFIFAEKRPKKNWSYFIAAKLEKNELLSCFVAGEKREGK